MRANSSIPVASDELPRAKYEQREETGGQIAIRI